MEVESHQKGQPNKGEDEQDEGEVEEEENGVVHTGLKHVEDNVLNKPSLLWLLCWLGFTHPLSLNIGEITGERTTCRGQCTLHLYHVAS